MKISLFIIVLCLTIASCSREHSNDLLDSEIKNIPEMQRYFVSAPLSPDQEAPDIATQTTGSLAVLRNEIRANGASLSTCTTIKVYLVTGADVQADIRGFQKAYSRVFGTRLVPKQPRLVQIQVVGLAQPNQRVLIEAECARQG